MRRNGYFLKLVTAGHFSAMFAAFSIPPFLSTILTGSFPDGLSYLGVCYAAPVLAAFLGYPLRMVLTTKIGERKALIASHIALAVIMAGISVADSPAMFLCGLILQGFVAPTFATSSSYLACRLNQDELVTGIRALQLITRVAAVLGPSLLGSVILYFGRPLQVYLLLALLLLITAFLLTLSLPSESENSQKKAAGKDLMRSGNGYQLWKPYIAQVLILFSASLYAPHFITYLQTEVKVIPDSLLGTVFSIPSIAYLCSVPLLQPIRKLRNVTLLCTGFMLVMLGLIGQWQCQQWMMVIICQVGIGMGTFISFTGINLYLVNVTQILGATKTFFRFELTGRCAMAAGAITGDFLVGIAGIKAPFLVSSALMMCALVFFFSIYSRSETQQSF